MVVIMPVTDRWVKKQATTSYDDDDDYDEGNIGDYDEIGDDDGGGDGDDGDDGNDDDGDDDDVDGRFTKRRQPHIGCSGSPLEFHSTQPSVDWMWRKPFTFKICFVENSF